jgi:hypothetical protein
MVYLTPAPLHPETPKAVRGEVRIVLKVHFSNVSIHLPALELQVEKGNGHPM